MPETTATPSGKTEYRLVKADERVLAEGQTPGMIRMESINHEDLWAGTAETEPGVTSAWHHHGDWETIAYVLSGVVRLEYGRGGREVAIAEPGDTLYIPKNAVHRESNPSDELQKLVIVRHGSGPVVIPEAGPAPA